MTTHGDPIVKGRYTGLHAFRHWYASWCINRKSDGGLELPYKTAQTRLGHSTLGKPLTHTDLLKRGLVPILLAVGLEEQLRDDQGRPRVTTHGDPIVKGRYTGLHAFRH